MYFNPVASNKLIATQTTTQNGLCRKSCLLFVPARFCGGDIFLFHVNVSAYFMRLTCLSQISLAHFCENGGPTSILCTQVLPVSCQSCWPPDSMSSSLRHLAVLALDRNGRLHDDRPTISDSDSAGLDAALAEHAHAALNLRSRATSKNHASGSRSSSKESGSKRKSYKVLEDDDGCVSCTISIPEEIRSKLPSGAPGSSRPDGNGRNGSPVLRSKEAVHACGSQHSDSSTDEDMSLQQGSPESSATDTASSSCHSHTLEFVTTSKPMKPDIHFVLQRASIRTLSCEQLPRGLTAGKIFFGDPTASYTIAYKFRLTDPYARGRQRHYALLALAGHEPGRAFKATPIIWRAFERIATSIATRTDRAMHENGEKARTAPVSSFLTQRTTDPDDFPRGNGSGGMRARGLAEMVGNDLFFAELHRSFVALLQCLGRQFGGVVVQPPVPDEYEK